MVKKKKLSVEEKEELAAEGKLPKMTVRKSEDRQLAWFVAIIVVVFAVTIGTYYWFEGVKSFEFDGVDWVYEEDVGYYHGRFENLLGRNYFYNIYLKNDPRKNNVLVEGTFDKFKYGLIISTSPEFDMCRGDASRVMRDLGAFMKDGLGTDAPRAGSTDEGVANKSERLFATCNSIVNRTVLIIERGDDFVAQNIYNPNCYTITVGDCNDASSVEKFMLKVIKDFGDN